MFGNTAESRIGADAELCFARFTGLPAARAKPAHQSLRRGPAKARRQLVGLDANVADSPILFSKMETV